MARKLFVILCIIFLFVAVFWPQTKYHYVQSAKAVEVVRQLSTGVFGPQEKPGHLFVTVDKTTKQLVFNNKIIQSLGDNFNVGVVSTEENHVVNTAKAVKRFIYKHINEQMDGNCEYVTLLSDVAWGTFFFRIVLQNGDTLFKDTYKTDVFYEVDNPIFDIISGDELIPDYIYTPNFIVSRIEKSWLTTDWYKLDYLKAEIAFPFYRFPTMDICSSCIWPAIDLSNQGNIVKKIAKNQGIDSVTLYETQSDEKLANQPDLSLNNSNFLEEFNQDNIIIADSSYEPGIQEEPYHTFYNTLMNVHWKDKIKNGHTDVSELEFEPFFEFVEKTKPIRRLGIIPLGKAPKHTDQFFSLLTLGDQIKSHEPKFLSGEIWEPFAQTLFLGATIAQVRLTLFAADETYRYSSVFATRFVLWGLPQTTIYDLVSQPKMEVPGELHIPQKQKETEFEIENKGDANLAFDIQSQSVFELVVVPTKGTIAPNEKQKIKVRISNNIPSGIYILSTPKSRMRIIHIRTNEKKDSEHSIKVFWVGI